MPLPSAWANCAERSPGGAYSPISPLVNDDTEKKEPMFLLSTNYQYEGENGSCTGN